MLCDMGSMIDMLMQQQWADEEALHAREWTNRSEFEDFQSH
jgi:hypothetical protein